MAFIQTALLPPTLLPLIRPVAGTSARICRSSAGEAGSGNVEPILRHKSNVSSRLAKLILKK